MSDSAEWKLEKLKVSALLALGGLYAKEGKHDYFVQDLAKTLKEIGCTSEYLDMIIGE